MGWLSKKVDQIRRKTMSPWLTQRPQRAILKTGDKNVFRRKLAKKVRWKFLQDMYTTLVDAQWRWTLKFIGVQFFGSWLIFALIWWFIAFVHGDLQEDHLPLRQHRTGWKPCIINIHGFHSCFLFSMETQHTTGYGLRMITEECPEAIFILCCQCLIGTIIDSFAIGIVFAKLVRAKFATSTIHFSKNAVMSIRDGKLCFMFRVGDIRRSKLVGIRIKAILIKSEYTREGEVLKYYQTELSLKADGGDSNLFLLWPVIIYHEIDEESPLYDFTVPELLKGQKVEIIVVLSATVESTGTSIETKSSYLASEILWGRRFESMVSFNKHRECYEIDWSKFDNTVLVNLPESTEEERAEGSDMKETTLLDVHHDPERPFYYPSPDSVKVVATRTSHDGWREVGISFYLHNSQDEMINSDYYETSLPKNTKASGSVWQPIKKSDRKQGVKSVCDHYPETIIERDEVFL